MRKAKIQKAWRNICEVVVLIVFIPFTTLTAHVRSHFPCYELKDSSGDKESLPSHVLVSFRIVCLLYPTYYIVKVDPFPEFGDEYVNIMIKSDEKDIVSYIYNDL